MTLIKFESLITWLKDNERSKSWLARQIQVSPSLINLMLSGKRTMSEYHKNNISQFPEHEKTMKKWISISSKFHKNFENMTKAKNHHKLALDKYFIETEVEAKSDDPVADQLKQLNELYKSGALTEEEFKKAKKKLLN